MIKKISLLVCSIFMLQMIFSCDYDCNRPQPTVNMEFTAIDLGARTFNDISNELELIVNSISKESLTLLVNLNSAEVASQEIEFKSFFAFNSANAIDCGPALKYNDLVNQINISMIDPNAVLPTKTVSTIFTSGTVSINSLIAEQTEFDPLQFLGLSCTQPDSLYDEAIFKIEAILESGEVLHAETESIQFKNI